MKTPEEYLQSFNMGFDEEDRFSDCDYSWDAVVSWMREYAEIRVKEELKAIKSKRLKK